ncbi:hypothetical protein HF995_01615 [Sanguibacter hominis ATCC BAA-789]|uniref:Uncharacterized protein n=1 Tax=Sanguibacter hominis ATCC BAA-789 TaxID=1312740 RepID=A0A9X5FCV3_9MICO|nr:hypothetical protein [Sanguibacter hominis]NKX91979.1 hypothetical protein [Sanguibacter hominis ATCC BAA-789]
MLADLSLSRVLASVGAWRLPPASAADPEAVHGMPAKPVGRPVAGPTTVSAPARTARPDGDLTDALPDAVALRARRRGYPQETVTALEASWSALGAARRAIAAPLSPTTASGLGPLRWAGEPARQHDPTTCGSTVLAQLAAAGDPVLALWLETGSRIGPVQPPELVAAARARQPGDTRFIALQRALKRRTAQDALLGMRWPDRFGTPPWGAARAARYADVTYRHAVVDAASPARLARAVAAVDAALRTGVPVPLFTGGTLRTGLATAVPRHVVLVTRATASGWHVFEPSRGEVLELRRDELAAPGRRPALGGWSVPAWVLLPR